MPQADVTLGALQARSPGRFTAHAIGVATGVIPIPGDADLFEEPSFWKQTLFGITQASLEAVLQGITQLLTSLVGGFGNLGNINFGTPSVNVSGTIDNQTTDSSGSVILLP
jgi:hypothetical protein